MKGIIFNLLEEVVSLRHGESAWDDLLESAGVAGAYTAIGNYPDEELELLVATAAKSLDLSREQCLRWFGREAMPVLARRYSVFFDGHRTTFPFLLSVNNIIHPEVRKIHPGAHCPVFRFEHAEDGALRLGYKSQRRLCTLAEGFIEGAAALFDETAMIEHVRCVVDGHEECLLSVRLAVHDAPDRARA